MFSNFKFFPHFRTIPLLSLYCTPLRTTKGHIRAAECPEKCNYLAMIMVIFIPEHTTQSLGYYQSVFLSCKQLLPGTRAHILASVQRFQQISGEETIHAHREANTHKAHKLYSEAQLTLPFLTQSNREAKSQAAKERS